jgi:hypothetical protein
VGSVLEAVGAMGYFFNRFPNSLMATWMWNVVILLLTAGTW